MLGIIGAVTRTPAKMPKKPTKMAMKPITKVSMISIAELRRSDGTNSRSQLA